MSKTEKLTKAQQRIVDKLQSGVVLIMGPLGPDGYTYHFGDGTTAHAGVVMRLNEKKVIVPAGDGMFGTSQTYKLAA